MNPKVISVLGAMVALGGSAFAATPQANEAHKAEQALGKVASVAPPPGTTIRDDDKKEAECHYRRERLHDLRKQYHHYKTEITQKCESKAFGAWYADYEKIQGTYNTHAGNIDRAIASVRTRLQELKQVDPCTEKMSLEACVAATEKVSGSDAALRTRLAELRKAHAAWAEWRQKRVAAERSEFHRDMGRCRDLDIWAEAVAGRVATYIKENREALQRCEKELSEIKHSNLLYRQAVKNRIVIQTARCTSLRKEGDTLYTAVAGAETALDAKKCERPITVVAWSKLARSILAAQEAAARKMPGANPGATEKERAAFVATGKSLIALKAVIAERAHARLARAAQCRNERAALGKEVGLLSALLQKDAEDLSARNIARGRLYEQLAKVNREIRD
jgi:hypothetical protein